jgi:glycosyltransferase involved in cell wall biosynthesis
MARNRNATIEGSCMKIALIAPPFIEVPPRTYGGTELFVAQLAEELIRRGHDVVVYANRESSVRCEVRGPYETSHWPLPDLGAGTLRALHHMAWALEDIARSDADVIHINDALAVPLTRFARQPAVATLHHPHDTELSALYGAHSSVTYVTISRAQQRHESMPRLRTIHHGIRLSDYRFTEEKRPYLCFLGRIAPIKGAHAAIAVARRCGLPLKLAGEIQPVFRDYWERQIAPHVDGRLVEYVGEATLETKNELLRHSRALLFPIEWDEPFGLVMIEAMACGTPVLALPGGAVEEVVLDGVSGWVCNDADDMARRAADLRISARSCRDYVERFFSVARMAAEYEVVYRSLHGNDLDLSGAAQHIDADVVRVPRQ